MQRGYPGPSRRCLISRVQDDFTAFFLAKLNDCDVSFKSDPVVLSYVEAIVTHLMVAPESCHDTGSIPVRIQCAYPCEQDEQFASAVQALKTAAGVQVAGRP